MRRRPRGGRRRNTYSAARPPPGVGDADEMEGAASADDPEMWRAAIAKCGEALRHNPDDVEAHRAMAYSYVLLGNHDEAVRCYDRAIERDELNPSLREDRGDSLYALERYEDAAASFADASRLNPSGHKARIKGAHMAHLMGRHDEAAAVFDDVISSFDGEAAADAVMFKAEMLENMGKHDEAAEALGRALEKDPGNDMLRARRAEALDAAGHGKEAVAEYKRSLRGRPKSARTLFNAGVALARQGRYADALEQFDKGMAINDTDGSTHRMRGDLLENVGRAKDAVEAYKRAVEIDPTDSLAFYNMGTALAGMGRHARAASAFRTAIRLRPSHAKSHGNLGTALYEMGKYRKALEAYGEAIRLNPRDAGAHYNSGLALFSLGRFGEAAKCYKRALEIDPGHYEARNSLKQAMVAKKAAKNAIPGGIVRAPTGMIILERVGKKEPRPRKKAKKAKKGGK